MQLGGSGLGERYLKRVAIELPRKSRTASRNPLVALLPLRTKKGSALRTSPPQEGACCRLANQEESVPSRGIRKLACR